MLKLQIRRGMKMFISAGNASLKENLNGLRLKLITLFIISTFVSGCSEFALISAAGGAAASQNAYAKAYGAVDFGVVLATDYDIKTHAYKKAKKVIHDKRR